MINTIINRTTIKHVLNAKINSYQVTLATYNKTGNELKVCVHWRASECGVHSFIHQFSSPTWLCVAPSQNPHHSFPLS